MRNRGIQWAAADCAPFLMEDVHLTGCMHMHRNKSSMMDSWSLLKRRNLGGCA